MAKVKKERADQPTKVASKGRVTKRLTPTSDDNMPKAKAPKRGAETGRTKQRTKKDPNAPKRGLSAYMFYANANRDRVRQENPDITFGQVGKTLGEEWKALEAPEKAKYEEMAKKDKKRYEEAKAAYNADADEEEASD